MADDFRHSIRIQVNMKLVAAAATTMFNTQSVKVNNSFIAVFVLITNLTQIIFTGAILLP